MNLKHVLHIAVVGVRPDVLVRPRIDELPDDPDVIVGAANASLEDSCDAEFLSDFAKVLVAVLIPNNRGPGNDFQIADL